jgi:hypothetical protein
MGPLDDQVVREDSLSATSDGLDIAIYTHWYRALPLPSVARLELTVDDADVNPDELEVSVNGNRYTFAQMRSRGDEYWFTTDPIVVHTPVETSAGQRHRVRLLLGLSIPYILTGPDREPLLAPSWTDKQLTAA